MSTRNHYDEDFKRTLVELYHNGKTQAIKLCLNLYISQRYSLPANGHNLLGTGEKHKVESADFDETLPIITIEGQFTEKSQTLNYLQPC